MSFGIRLITLFCAGLWSVCTLAQTRHVATARATANLDELARQPKSQAAANDAAPREIYEPERAVRRRNSSKPAARPRRPQVAISAPRTVIPTFSGFQALADNFTAIPPDTEGAVGPQHVVTMLNTQVMIHSRNGVPRSNFPISLNGFWSPLGGFSDTFDPRIEYDKVEDRWIACAAVSGDSPASAMLLAVSQTGDPGGSWNYFKVDVGTANRWGDFPALGFNGNWVVVSMNMFKITGGGNYIATNLYVFSKADLYRNGTGAHTTFSDPNGEFTPVRDDDNGHPDTLYLVQEFAADFGPVPGTGAIRVSKLEGAVGGETFKGGNVGTINIDDPWSDTGPSETDFGPQLGTTSKVDTGDSRLDNCVMRSGTIWCAHTVFLPYGAPTRAAVQWLQIDPSGTAPKLVQLGRIDDPSATYFYAYPTIAVNKNNEALIAYTRFSANDYPSAAFAMRIASDPPNTMQPGVLLKAGEAPYVRQGARSGSNRWGDYSATRVDPVNDLDFWTLQEYAATPPSSRTGAFATWWAHVSTLSAGPAFLSEGVVNAASLQGGAVTPGEVITIFGTNLGPASLQKPVPTASGELDTIAAGTRVLFDGIAAPILYSVSGQTGAIAPFGLQQRSNTQLQVEYLGARSASIALTVAPAAPAIFTANQSGKGQGSILNQDYTINSAAAPAAPGSILMIYATGGGAMATPVLDGSIAQPPYATVAQDVAVRIGGVPAQVLYQGSAPGIVQGVLQINAVVPESIAVSGAVPIELTVGGVSSPAGVTVAVR